MSCSEKEMISSGLSNQHLSCVGPSLNTPRLWGIPTGTIYRPISALEGISER